jgi:zinc transporter ZupT
MNYGAPLLFVVGSLGHTFTLFIIAPILEILDLVKLSFAMSESNSRSLRIAGIFITLAASVVGFGIPYLRGPPKTHEEAMSTSWMSLKTYSAGVILGVAVIHLLGEALVVLSELAESEEEHAEEEHAEEEEHGHSFPIGLTLCLVGISLTLGIELAASLLMQTGDVHSEDSAKDQELMLNVKGKDSENGGNVCTDPYRLESEHKHHVGERVNCNNVTNVTSLKKISCEHDTYQACSSSCKKDTSSEVALVTMGHDHMHHEDHMEMPSAGPSATELGKNGHVHSASNEMGCILDVNVEDIHRHVSIIVEDPRRSVIKSIVLEAAIAIHSVIIGVSLGGAEEGLPVLLAAFAFHQVFEGISLGSASLQAGYSYKTALIFMAVFALSIPIGIIIGLNVPSTPDGDKMKAFFGCLAAGSLIYTSLVEMVAEDFTHFMNSHGTHSHSASHSHSQHKKFGNKSKAVVMYFSFVAGLISMTVLAKWA